jgi:hypothetical protein
VTTKLSTWAMMVLGFGIWAWSALARPSRADDDALAARQVLNNGFQHLGRRCQRRRDALYRAQKFRIVGLHVGGVVFTASHCGAAFGSVVSGRPLSSR